MTNQQCQSTEGSSGPKDRLQSHQVHLTVLQTYACIQHTVIHNTKMSLSTVKWAQWDKTQSKGLLGHSLWLCMALCTIVAHNIAQNRPDNFPSYPPDNHHRSDDVYLREGGQTPLNVPIHVGASTFPCNTCSLDPLDSASETASWSVQPFLTAHSNVQ